MTIHDKVKAARFKKLNNMYSEVLEYFNSESFINRLVDEDSVHIPYYIYYSNGNVKEYNKELPITDGNGLVDIEEVVELLRLEGLNARVFSSINHWFLGVSYDRTK